MKTTTYVVLTLAAAVTAQADFSYTSTQKAPTGMAAGAGVPSSRNQTLAQGTEDEDRQRRQRHDHGFSKRKPLPPSTSAQKTYSVMKFNDLGQTLRAVDIETKIDIKETGQKKLIGDYQANEIVMTWMSRVLSRRKAGMKMQVEVDM